MTSARSAAPAGAIQGGRASSSPRLLRGLLVGALASFVAFFGLAVASDVATRGDDAAITVLSGPDQSTATHVRTRSS